MWKELVASVETRGAVRESKLAALLFRFFPKKNSNWLSGVRRNNSVLEDFVQQANSYVGCRSSSSFHLSCVQCAGEQYWRHSRFEVPLVLEPRGCFLTSQVPH